MAPTAFTKVARSWTRLDGVDLFRGFAILFVLMNHVNMQLLGTKVPYTQGFPPQLVHSLAWNGQFGVQMFFAVSGLPELRAPDMTLRARTYRFRAFSQFTEARTATAGRR
jgi:hypothetical protein